MTPTSYPAALRSSFAPTYAAARAPPAVSSPLRLWPDTHLFFPPFAAFFTSALTAAAA